MKKKILFTATFLAFANTSFALTDQLIAAENYLSVTQEPNTKMLVMAGNLLNNNVVADKTSVTIAPVATVIESSPEEYSDWNVDLHKGQKNKTLKLLQKQWGLEETGIYSEDMVKKVKDLQEKNKLNPTGILDKTTWFNIYKQPEEWNNETVQLALDNWKTIIAKNENAKSDKMIVVNIPSMKLYLYQKNMSGYDLLMESRVIVGRVKLQTPLHDFDLISLKYNPTWTPTPNMLKKNLYKNGELNTKWIESHHLSIYDETGTKRDIEEVGSLEKVRFTQESGERNALGNLKFETSSKEDIYLHDTNERHYFGVNTRTYSSGCVRVQDYVELASLITGKSVDYVKGNIAKEKMFYEKIPRTPVYFDYSQIHFDDKKPHFFSDIYSRRKFKK